MLMRGGEKQIREASAGSIRRGIAYGCILLSLLWGCTSVDVQNPSDLPIGVVDPQRILQETIKGQRLSDTLNAFMKDRQALVELEQKELRKLEEELMAQSKVLSHQFLFQLP